MCRDNPVQRIRMPRMLEILKLQMPRMRPKQQLMPRDQKRVGSSYVNSP